MKGGNSLLIHRMHLDDHYVVLDVNSGAVHIIDKMIYDILGFYDGNNPEETKAHFKGKYADSDVEEGNLDNYIHFLRRRLTTVGSSLSIKTLRGFGYCLKEK